MKCFANGSASHGIQPESSQSSFLVKFWLMESAGKWGGLSGRESDGSAQQGDLIRILADKACPKAVASRETSNRSYSAAKFWMRTVGPRQITNQLI